MREIDDATVVFVGGELRKDDRLIVVSGGILDPHAT